MLAWWLAGKENMDVTAETNSLNSLLLPEEEPIGYKPFGLPESALPVKTRAVCMLRVWRNLELNILLNQKPCMFFLF
jgi:hypothetical protein